MADIPKPVMDVEGEGSYSAAKDYAERQAEFERTHDADELGEQAAKDVREHPDEFRRAEQVGKDKARH